MAFSTHDVTIKGVRLDMLLEGITIQGVRIIREPLRAAWVACQFGMILKREPMIEPASKSITKPAVQPTIKPEVKPAVSRSL